MAVARMAASPLTLLTMMVMMMAAMDPVAGGKKWKLLKSMASMLEEYTIRSRDCSRVQKAMKGNCPSGLYTIYPYRCCPQYSVEVYCDMETDGGGWTVIQRRDDIQPHEDFNRTWIEYALGFGNLSGEFWLGNDHIHALTDQTFSKIRFDMADFENETRYAEYRSFYVHDRNSSYKMEVNTYSGDAGDGFASHNGMMFTTKDKDLDIWSYSNCAPKFKGGWWYASCHAVNPNGYYYGGEHESNADGVNWYHWHGYNYSLKKVEIKIKPNY